MMMKTEEQVRKEMNDTPAGKFLKEHLGWEYYDTESAARCVAESAVKYIIPLEVQSGLLEISLKQHEDKLADITADINSLIKRFEDAGDGGWMADTANTMHQGKTILEFLKHIVK